MTDPWYDESNPFNFTATGYLGVKRPTMLFNHLLQKSRVGVANPKPYDVSSDMVFGECCRGPWTAAHALTGWSGHLLYSEKKRQKKKQATDFVQQNRGSLTGAITSVDGVRQFRKIKFPVKSLFTANGAERPVAKVFKPSDVFGKPNIPTSNIGDLVSGGYQKQWMRNTQAETYKKQKRIDFTKVRPTRASVVRPHIVHTGIRRLPWRSPCFQRKALPAISSFRSEKAHDDAWNALTLESTGREGQAGQGITMSKPHEHQLPPLPGQCPP